MYPAPATPYTSAFQRSLRARSIAHDLRGEPVPWPAVNDAPTITTSGMPFFASSASVCSQVSGAAGGVLISRAVRAVRVAWLAGAAAEPEYPHEAIRNVRQIPAADTVTRRLDTTQFRRSMRPCQTRNNAHVARPTADLRF